MVAKASSISRWLLLSVAIANLHLVAGFTATSWAKRNSLLQLQQASKDSSEKSDKLGLITFDLDDTLYPIDPVVAEANDALIKCMAGYGFEGLTRNKILQTAKDIRAEVAQEDSPEAAAILTNRQVREMAIRREMELVIRERKIQACADDWDTSVEDLSPVVLNSAKAWAKKSVSESMVQAVYNTWNMERHHAAERHLYPEVMEALQQIKKDHPNAIIGAVTDGLSNPLLMTFTLASVFDFSCSWEDDQGQRQKFFTDLDKTGGNTDELTWIYDEARFLYAQLQKAEEGMSPPTQLLQWPQTYDDKVWIHVGDDLALDVGGSAACGAKTILCELDSERYDQTARFRFDKSRPQPSWSIVSREEMDMRQKMRTAAKDKVDVRLQFLSDLPKAINEILEGQS